MSLLKLRAVPFIETSCTEEAKKLFNTPFSFDMIYHDKNESVILFDDWYLKDKGTYKIYLSRDNSKVSIEHYSIGYTINSTKGTFSIAFHPLTIDQFITDCQRAGIELIWSEKLLTMINYQQLLKGSEIKNYHVTLLHRIEKSDDIL